MIISAALSLNRDWPRGAWVLLRQQKARFLLAASVGRAPAALDLAPQTGAVVAGDGYALATARILPTGADR